MNNELIGIFKIFDDLTIEQQRESLMAILEIANTDPAKLEEAVKNKEFNEENHLPILYEALSKDMDRWADFFLIEIKRILDNAKKSKTPKKVLNLLDEFAFIDPDTFKHRAEFVEILKRELDHKNPIFRYYAVSLLSDFVKENDYNAMDKLKRMLGDPNWRIRYWAYVALRDLTKIGRQEQLSLFDRFRSKFLDTLKFE
jgi:hypothetical protein